MSNSLRPHESQHARPPCPSPTPRVHSDSHPSSSDAIQPSHPLSSPFPPALNPSQHQGLSQWFSSSHQVPKYWSFSFSINPSNQYSGLISFRIDWFDLLAVQGTLQESSSAPQFKSINSLVPSFLHSPTLTSRSQMVKFNTSFFLWLSCYNLILHTQHPSGNRTDVSVLGD